MKIFISNTGDVLFLIIHSNLKKCKCIKYYMAILYSLKCYPWLPVVCVCERERFLCEYLNNLISHSETFYKAHEMF